MKEEDFNNEYIKKELRRIWLTLVVLAFLLVLNFLAIRSNFESSVKEIISGAVGETNK